MVKIALKISATLENIDELKTCYPNYSFFIKIRCSSCGETTDKWHDITESESVRKTTGAADGFNFFMKCKMCGRENSIDIIEKSNDVYRNDDSGKFKTIVIFDCRGSEPFEFSPREGWVIKSSNNGQCFENVDLSEDDWTEYDQINKNCVGVYEFKSEFVKMKK